jgi:hypothetical protein
VMIDLGGLVVFENLVQTPVSPAIGMEEQNHPVRACSLMDFSTCSRRKTRSPSW